MSLICKLILRLAAGWTVQGSNPGRGKRFFSPKLSGLALGPTQAPVKWVMVFFLASKAPMA